MCVLDLGCLSYGKTEHRLQSAVATKVYIYIYTYAHTCLYIYTYIHALRGVAIGVEKVNKDCKVHWVRRSWVCLIGSFQYVDDS